MSLNFVKHHDIEGWQGDGDGEMGVGVGGRLSPYEE